MSKQTKKSPTLTLDGFCGIDLRCSHTNPDVAQDVLNFRVRGDGSLEKRYGYRLLANLGGIIRASWIGSVGGSSIGYFIVGNRVIRFNLDTKEQVSLGTVSAASQNAFFFFYEGELYLSDGSKLYQVKSNLLSTVEGYAPLIGKDWNNRSPGEDFEPKNILTKRARISYVISDPPSNILQIKEPIQSIDGVLLNGEVLPADRYYMDTNFGTVNVSNLQAGDRVMLYVTLDTSDSNQLSKLHRSSCAIAFGKNTSNRLLFLDRNNSSTMLCSSYVPKQERKLVSKIYLNTSPLYIPENATFVVGNRHCAVQSAQPYYDRLLLFTEEDAWMASSEVSSNDEFPTTNINTLLGCAVKEGSLSIGNEIYSIGSHGLWRWASAKNFSGEMEAECVSLPIDPLLSREDYRCATISHNRLENEIWLHFSTRSDIFIYNLSLKLWYRFNGIIASRFFGCDAYFGFIRGTSLYVFDSSLLTDSDDNTTQKPISSEYLSAFCDFGTPENKNVKRIILEGDFYRNTVTFTVRSPLNDLTSCKFTNSGNHTTLSTRCSSPPFRSAGIHLHCNDTRQLKLHRASVLAR